MSLALMNTVMSLLSNLLKSLRGNVLFNFSFSENHQRKPCKNGYCPNGATCESKNILITDYVHGLIGTVYYLDEAKKCTSTRITREPYISTGKF